MPNCEVKANLENMRATLTKQRDAYELHFETFIQIVDKCIEVMDIATKDLDD